MFEVLGGGLGITQILDMGECPLQVVVVQTLSQSRPLSSLKLVLADLTAVANHCLNPK